MSDTPRTDAEIEDLENGLRHMADDHLCCRATALDTIELLNALKRERDQLREWAAMWRMRAHEAASRLAAQGLERKTK
jgi:hypothetical protein